CVNAVQAITSDDHNASATIRLLPSLSPCVPPCVRGTPVSLLSLATRRVLLQISLEPGRNKTPLLHRQSTRDRFLQDAFGSSWCSLPAPQTCVTRKKDRPCL